MVYKYADIFNLKLPNKYLSKFLGTDDVGNFDYDNFSYSYAARIQSHAYKSGMDDYKNRIEYLFAGNAVERAKAAMLGPRDILKQEILDKWIAVVSQMSKFEKVMAGWPADKI